MGRFIIVDDKHDDAYRRDEMRRRMDYRRHDYQSWSSRRKDDEYEDGYRRGYEHGYSDRDDDWRRPR